MNVKVLVEHSVKVSPCGTKCHRGCGWRTIAVGASACCLFETGSGKSRLLRRDQDGNYRRLPQCLEAETLALVVSP